jgi:hypothetical protein
MVPTIPKPARPKVERTVFKGTSPKTILERIPSRAAAEGHAVLKCGAKTLPSHFTSQRLMFGVAERSCIWILTVFQGNRQGILLAACH